MWSESDSRYWLAKENDIEKVTVDLADYGFVVASRSYEKGWTDDPKLYGRVGAVQALVKAREALPDGMNIKVFDGWRPWSQQEKAAADAREKIAAAHPDWSDEEVDAHQWKMAPPARIVPRLGSHRYGGAFDISLVSEDGTELCMGVEVGYNTGPEAQLLYYQWLEQPNEEELLARNNRQLMIHAMQAAGFHPYLEEFWHWNYLRDFEMAAKDYNGSQ